MSDDLYDDGYRAGKEDAIADLLEALEAVLAELDALEPRRTASPWKAIGLPYDGLNDPVIVGGPGEVYVAQTVYDMQSGSQEHDVDADTQFIVAVVNAWTLIRKHLVP